MSEIPPYPPPPPLPPEPETPPAADEPVAAEPAVAAPQEPVQAAPLVPAKPQPPAAPAQPGPPAPYPTYPSPPPAPSPPMPEYGVPPYPYGYASAPAQPRSSRNVRVMIVGGILIVALLLTVIGYVFAGYVYASSRISAAAGAINALDSHRGYVNTTFDLLDQQVSTIATQVDGSVGKATATSMVTESQGLTSSVAGDEQGLVAARTHLSEQQWLTSLSQGRLDAEASRVDHGRKAVTTVRSAAADYVALGHFLEDYYQAITDLNALVTDASVNDVVGAAGADSSARADLTKALQSSTSVAGLPAELHDRLIVLQAFAEDFGKLLNAYATGDRAGYDAAGTALTADEAKLKAYDPAVPVAKIKTYYRQYRIDFNSELDKATS